VGADVAVGIGLIGAVGSAITGLTDWQHVGGAPRRVGLAHAMLNVGSTILFATSLVMRKRNSRGAAKAISLTGYALSLTAARLGGELVYRHRIGVDHAPEEKGPETFTAVLAESELAFEQPRKAEVNGIAVVLVKTTAGIFALAEKCAHLGGPLSEGTCKNGMIQCPWHASQFALSDGRVLHGPSVHPQVSFETRVRDGQVEIRRVTGKRPKGPIRRDDAA
jgi:nitrite reductase/ring-hydroxylating ferredoxin subunit